MTVIDNQIKATKLHESHEQVLAALKKAAAQPPLKLLVCRPENLEECSVETAAQKKKGAAEVTPHDAAPDSTTDNSSMPIVATAKSATAPSSPEPTANKPALVPRPAAVPRPAVRKVSDTAEHALKPVKDAVADVAAAERLASELHGCKAELCEAKIALEASDERAAAAHALLAERDAGAELLTKQNTKLCQEVFYLMSARVCGRYIRVLYVVYASCAVMSSYPCVCVFKIKYFGINFHSYLWSSRWLSGRESLQGPMRSAMRSLRV